jgi:hypothetical protein
MGAKTRLFFRRFRGVSHVTGTLPKIATEPLKLLEGHAGHIQELRGAGLHVGEP